MVAAEEKEEEEAGDGGVDGGKKAREGLMMAAPARKRGKRKQGRLITIFVAWGVGCVGMLSGTDDDENG